MKKVKLSFHLILTLAVMLMMAQTAWAIDPVTKTISFSTGTRSNDQLSVIVTDPDDNTSKSVITANGTTNDIGITSTLKISNKTSSYSTGTEVSLLISPYVNGKVTKIEFTSVMRGARVNNGTFSMSIDGMKYNGTDATLTGNISGYESVTFISNSSEGIAGNLTMRLGVDAVFQINKSSCQMIITYIPSAAPTHSHNFSFNAVGNTLTATCGLSDGLDCSLADAGYQATLTLTPPVDTYYRPNSTYSAHHNLSGFNTLTGLNTTATDITYVNNTTGSNLGSTAPTTAGNYTASVTATIGGTNYTLTTDFKVNTENSINNNIRQISLNKTNAANDEEITITFTPRSHELVNTLTVTGTTTNMSLGNGITDNGDNTYTFTMPYEEVTIGATFKSSDASLYKYTITTDITGSGAVDYNAEEYLGAGDAITITFMPYLQGNLEAGSVVLEGLTVTGATTNMSVGNGITDNSDNTYTFTMPGENVTVTAKAYLSADAILAGTINEPIYIKQGNGIQIGCNNKWTYVNDGALPLVIPDGNTLRLAGGTDVRLDLADKNAIACEGDAIVELIPNEVSNEIGIGDRPERNSGKATIKVGPAGKTLTIRVADESTETVHLTVKSISQYDRNCDVIGCDEGGLCGSIVVESGQVESRVYFNYSGRAFRTTDGTITFGYKYPDDKIIFDGGSEGTVKIEDGKQFHSYTSNTTKYSGTINLQGINSFNARPDKYTVNYCEHDGQNQKVKYVAHGMPFSFKAATPEYEGHEFRGWKNMVTDEVYEHDFIVTNDLNIIAQWSKLLTKLLTNADITVAEIPDQTYNGSAIEPEVVVTDGETPLVLDTDYEVSYSDNTNAGTSAKVTITGKGKYSGTVEKAFTINPRVTEDGALTLTEYGDRTTATIDGSSNSSISIDDDIIVNEVTYTRTFESGSYTVMLPFGFTVDGTVNGKFYTLKSIEPKSETVSVAKMSDPIETVEANKPYIFVPNAPITEIKITGKTTLHKTVGAPLTNVCENRNWKLHGVYDKKVWTNEDVNLYGFAAAPIGEIAAGEFVHFVTGASLKPTRCYLEYSKDGFSKSTIELPEKIIVVFPDETASIVEPGDPDNTGDITTPTAEITPNSGIKVWSADGSVIIEAQPDMDYTIVDLGGRILKNGVTHSTRETVTLSRRAASIVIVKIGNQTFKISY